MFTFVDQITQIDSRQARGRYAIPAALHPFPPWLLAEAVGQLAAWIAISDKDFRLRPVAALIGELSFSEQPTAGTLELEAFIERADDRAVLYSGQGSCAGVPVSTILPPAPPPPRDTVPRHLGARTRCRP